MYGFILNMWVMNRIDADQVHAFSPTFITAAQAEAIIATEQVREV